MKKKAGKGLLYFLILMLCCTVMARGASSMTTAKVKTVTADKGVLIQKAEGKGTIIAGNEHYQSLPNDQKIKEILVKPQTEVEEGQALIQFDMDYLGEKTEEARRKVEKLELQLQQQQAEAQADARTPETAQAEISLNTAEETLNQAQAAYEQAVGEYNTLAGNPPQAAEGDAGNSIEEEGASLDVRQQWEQELEAARQKADSADEALESQVIAYNQAVEQYNLAVRNEENARKNQEKQDKANAISRQSLQVDIEAAREELQKLMDIEDSGGVVGAGFSGIFQQADVSVGAVTTGTEQITIASAERVVRGLISSEDEGKIREGDKIEITPSGQTKSVQVEVTRLEQSTGQQSEEMLSMVWYGIPEEDMNQTPLGTGFTYVSARESSSYEQIIPLSALHEEQGKNYVLTATIREGILGETYTAVSVPVTILDKDDENAAVKAVLERDSLIIISSSKYVEEGDSVRLE